MSFTTQNFEDLLHASSVDVWQKIVAEVLEACSQPLSQTNGVRDIVRRDRHIEPLDHFLSSVGWDLWRSFGNDVERTSERLSKWWLRPHAAKAVLVLDGLSLRELPLLLEGAKQHGFDIGNVSATASEIPGDTNEFARSLGFGSRSQLQNNGGGASHKLAPARTECVDLPWRDCANLIDASPNWIFWHPWPDAKLHAVAGVGQGLDTLARETIEHLTSEDFWHFVGRLAQGRELVITSDHGYAATGQFHDATGDQGTFLKTTFKSGRSVPDETEAGAFVPPVALAMDNQHGQNLLALGRWKWRSQGGYPTLAHGGLSLLEVLSPFVELRRQGAK
jgi:hypothetical protein